MREVAWSGSSVEGDLIASANAIPQADSDSGKVEVAYVDAQGKNMGTVLCERIPSQSGGNDYYLKDGCWYAVTSDTVRQVGTYIDGNVNLILCDGATLRSDSTIVVPGGTSLTIWGQKEGTGKLVVTGSLDCAGIGSWWNSFRDNDKKYRQRGCGAIIINGGDITATGSDGAAGIGGARNHAGNVTINGGTVHATGGLYAAGIGNGNGATTQGTVTINGGFVEANGGQNGGGSPEYNGDKDGGAGIGSACNSDKGTKVTITGGTVKATGGGGAAGIGGTYKSTNDVITIAGGDVSATAGKGASGIGRGYENSGKTATITLDYNTANPGTRVFATSYRGTLNVKQNFVDEADSTLLVNKGTYKNPANLAEKTLIPVGTHRIYVDSGKGGTLVANRSVAAAGNTVIVKATPKEGCQLKKVEVLRYYTDAEKEKLSEAEIEKPIAEVTPFGIEGMYKFTAPDFAVLVKATWVDTTYYTEWTWNGSELVGKQVDVPDDAQFELTLTAGKNIYTIPSGVYFVDKDTVIDKGLRIEGDVTIIIPDEVSVDVLGNLTLFPGSTFTLYGQESCSGSLNVKGVEGSTSRSFWITGGKFVYKGATVNATGGMLGSSSLEYGFEVVHNGEAALVDDRGATCNQDAELLTITKCHHGDGVVFHVEDGKKIGVCKYCNAVIDGGLGFGGFKIETLEGAPQIDSDNMEDVVSGLLTS